MYRYLIFISVHMLTLVFYFVTSYLYDITAPFPTMAWVFIPTTISLVIVWRIISFIANGRDMFFYIFWLLSIILGTLISIRPTTQILKVQTIEIDSIQQAIDLKNGMFKAQFDIEVNYDEMKYRSKYIGSYGSNKIGLTAREYQKELLFPLKDIDNAVFVINYEEPSTNRFAKGFKKQAKKVAQEYSKKGMPKYFMLYTNNKYEQNMYYYGEDDYTYEEDNYSYYNRDLDYMYILIGQEQSNEHITIMKLLKFISIIFLCYVIVGICVKWWK